MEAGVGIEGRPPSALLLRAQFRPDNTGSGGSWQHRSSSARAAPIQCSFTEEFTEGIGSNSRTGPTSFTPKPRLQSSARPPTNRPCDQSFCSTSRVGTPLDVRITNFPSTAWNSRLNYSCRGAAQTIVVGPFLRSATGPAIGRAYSFSLMSLFTAIGFPNRSSIV